MVEPLTAGLLWHSLALPVLRLCLSVSLGLFIGNLIESLNWARGMARLASPLVRLARLKDISGASFSLAFFSGAAANTMLAEALDSGRMTRREVVLSNLFNSLPTYFLHLPTLFFVAAPFLGSTAVLYVSLTVLAALLRTAFIVILGRLTLPPLPEGCVVCHLRDEEPGGLRRLLEKTLARFRKRLLRIILVTIPIYTLFFFLKRWGAFEALETWMAHEAGVLAMLPPEAMSIVAFHIAAESTAGFAAAGALINADGLTTQQVVLALLVGNVLSTPVRAVRHQLPYYAGIFKTPMAVRLVAHNQTLRAASLILVAAAYVWLS